MNTTKAGAPKPKRDMARAREYAKALGASAVLVSLLGPGTAVTQETPGLSSLYYEIGGGRAIGGGLNAIVTLNPRTATPRLPSACELWHNRDNLDDYWDAVVEAYVEQQLDAAKGIVAGMVAIVRNAPDMIAVSVLQRAQPGMFEFMTNMLSRLDVQANISMRSCEAAVARMDQGIHPADAWLQIGQATYWQNGLAGSEAQIEGGEDEHQEGDPTLLDAHDDAPDQAPATPIKWFGGDKGASPGEPIVLVEGVVAAGYAAASSKWYTGATVTPVTDAIRPVLGGDPSVPVTGPTPLSLMFPTQASAVELAREVLGEQSILYCKEAGCDSTFTAGIGLKKEYDRQYKKLIEAWTALLTEFPSPVTKRATITRLQAVSGSVNVVTPALYDALVEMAPADRSAFINRLASDVALENTIDRGFGLRQMVLSGSMTQEVQSYDLTREKAEQLADVAMEAVMDLSTEVEIRKGLASNTASLIMQARSLSGLSGSDANLGGGRTAPAPGVQVR